MNEFYSISEKENKQTDKFQLPNLGVETISMIFGSLRGSSKSIYRKVTKEDYDELFTNSLISFKPPYELENLLDYHLNYYKKSKKNKKTTFLKHMKYVVLPIVKKRKNTEVQTELLTNWIQSKMGKANKNKKEINFKTGDINSPVQFQINSDNSTQLQSIEYSNENILELFDLIKKDLKDLHSEDSKELTVEIENSISKISKGKTVKNRLLVIGELIKEIGIGTFTNLVSSPLYELIKPLLGI